MKKAEKLLRIIQELNSVWTITASKLKDEEKDKVFIKRFYLKQIIQDKLNIVDAHTVNGWVTRLLALGVISPNPTSQLSANKQVIKPSNDTRYFINHAEAKAQIQKLHPHTLMFFSRSPDDQEETKDNLV